MWGNSLDKLRHTRSVAYSAELVLLNKHQISGGGAYLDKKLHLKDCFGMEFTTCSCELMPEKALTSFTISDAYRYFAGQS